MTATIEIETTEEFVDGEVVEVSTEIAVIEEVDEGPEPLTERKAQALDKKVRTAGDKVDTTVSSFVGLLKEAALGRIHVGLGLPSWPAYVKDVAQDNKFLQLVAKNRIDRKELATEMSATGMSQRAIAGALGVSQKTIDRDLEGEEFDTDQVTTLDGRTAARNKATTPTTEEIIDAEVEEVTEEPVHAYTAVELIDEFDIEAANLHNALAAMEEIMTEDKWGNARKRVAKAHLNNLGEFVNSLQAIIDDLTVS